MLPPGSILGTRLTCRRLRSDGRGDQRSCGIATRGEARFGVSGVAPGIGWSSPRRTKARHWLEIGAASLIADVWLNGEHLGQHKGAFTAFRFDVTDELNDDGENLLVIKADNREPAEEDDPTAIAPLGVRVAFTSLNPTFGTYLGIIPALPLALAQTVPTAVLTVLAYVVIQQMQDNVLTPGVQGQTAHVHPILVLLTVIWFGLAFELFWSALAVAALVVVRVLFDVFRVRLRVRPDDEPIRR